MHMLLLYILQYTDLEISLSVAVTGQAVKVSKLKKTCVAYSKLIIHFVLKIDTKFKNKPNVRGLAHSHCLQFAVKATATVDTVITSCFPEGWVWLGFMMLLRGWGRGTGNSASTASLTYKPCLNCLALARPRQSVTRLNSLITLSYQPAANESMTLLSMGSVADFNYISGSEMMLW